MYSYEDRIRAVKLYIRLGKRLAMTVRQLGYPTTKALERWYRIYEKSQDLPAGRICSKPKYSDEQKRAAVDHYLSHGRCLAATVKALGYPVDVTLAAWLDERHPARKARVVGKATPDAALVNTMLDAALETVADSIDRPVVHSDRGAHYRWPGCLSRTGDAKLIRSMSRKGCSPDNAACEGFFGRLKTELFYPRHWQAMTIDQFIEVVGSYIHWYNDKRIKLSLC